MSLIKEQLHTVEEELYDELMEFYEQNEELFSKLMENNHDEWNVEDSSSIWELFLF